MFNLSPKWHRKKGAALYEWFLKRWDFSCDPPDRWMADCLRKDKSSPDELPDWETDVPFRDLDDAIKKHMVAFLMSYLSNAQIELTPKHLVISAPEVFGFGLEIPWDLAFFGGHGFGAFGVDLHYIDDAEEVTKGIIKMIETKKRQANRQFKNEEQDDGHGEA